MPDYLIITARAIGAYIVLLALTRLMGKREISQLSYFDYIVGITIGMLTGVLITSTSSSFWVILPALLVFGALQLLSSYLSLKSRAFRQFFQGSPVVLIENGNILRNNLRKTRINMDELSGMLREKSAFRLADVEFAVMETDGSLSIQKKPGKQPVTPSDLGLTPAPQGMPQTIITDGELDKNTLEKMGFNEGWLSSKMAAQGVYDLNKIMLAQADSQGHLFIDLKEPDTSTQNSTVLLMLDKLHSDFSSYQQQTQNPLKSAIYAECALRINNIRNQLNETKAS